MPAHIEVSNVMGAGDSATYHILINRYYNGSYGKLTMDGGMI
jgi:hypothetical protein